MPQSLSTSRSLPWIAWIGASALLTELFLIRVFDAIVGPSAAYALVGLALFGISLAGVATAVRPGLSRPRPLAIALALAASPVLTWLVLRWVPFSIAKIPEAPLVQGLSFALLGLALTTPFFLSALAVIQLLASGSIRKVYAADLAGSAVGPWLLPGLLPLAGPAGVLLCLAGGQLLGAALWAAGPSRNRRPKARPDRDPAPGSKPVARDATVSGSDPMAIDAPVSGPGPMAIDPPVSGRDLGRNSESFRGPRPLARAAQPAYALLGTVAIALSLSGSVADWDVPSHAEKRSVEETRLREDAEFRRWDAVSKIEVVDLTEIDPATGTVVSGTGRKLISYDGGAQSSHIYAFDGDLARLRLHLGEHIPDHFWQRGVVAAHWFHRDSGARVFVAGCAGGQEVTAALLFGASEVLAVDLVGTVVELGKERYAEYNGGIFLDPRVRFVQGEARTELARSQAPFDIIGIFSYHNSSRVAAGSLALKAFYLQTAETYALCLERLTANGVLQIHQGFFPRVITTLAEAWRLLGREDLERHVLVYGRDGVEDHYTILVKQSAWTEAEVRDVDAFLLAEFPSEGRHYTRIENPTLRDASFLPDALYRTPLADSLLDRAAFRISPVTDDTPFSLHLRKGLGRVDADPTRFTTPSEAVLLNELIPERIPLPRDIAHLLLLGVAGLFVSLLAFVATAYGSKRGSLSLRRRDETSPGAESGRGWTLGPAVYFYLVGLAFIGVEWTLVQFAMRLIALPIPAFGTALGVVLVGAALGSWSSERLRAVWVFPMIVILGATLLLVFPSVLPRLWGAPLEIRVLAFVLTVLPLAFFMGFPFPSALASLRTNREIASAWALNGAASVTGSVVTAALFAAIGVAATGAIALGVYAGAGLLYRAVGRGRSDPGSAGEAGVTLGSQGV